MVTHDVSLFLFLKFLSYITSVVLVSDSKVIIQTHGSILFQILFPFICYRVLDRVLWGCLL